MEVHNFERQNIAGNKNEVKTVGQLSLELNYVSEEQEGPNPKRNENHVLKFQIIHIGGTKRDITS